MLKFSTPGKICARQGIMYDDAKLAYGQNRNMS